MSETAPHVCPPMPDNPICKHGRPRVIAQHQECKGTVNGITVHELTGMMVLCPNCLQESYAQMMVVQ